MSEEDVDDGYGDFYGWMDEIDSHDLRLACIDLLWFDLDLPQAIIYARGLDWERYILRKLRDFICLKQRYMQEGRLEMIYLDKARS